MATLIIVCIISFIFGDIVGIFIGLLLINSGEASKKHDFYQEGFMDGYNKGKKE